MQSSHPQIEAYYILSYNRLKLGKVGESLEAATAAKNCVEELTYLGYEPSMFILAFQG